MAVDQIHVAGVAAFESKDNTPVAGHRDRPETRKITFEWVQPEAGQIRQAGGLSRSSSGLTDRAVPARDPALNYWRVSRAVFEKMWV